MVFDNKCRVPSADDLELVVQLIQAVALCVEGELQMSKFFVSGDLGPQLEIGNETILSFLGSDEIVITTSNPSTVTITLSELVKNKINNALIVGDDISLLNNDAGYITGVSWGDIGGTLSNQTDLTNALNSKFNIPTGTTSQYIRGDGSLATFPNIEAVHDGELTLGTGTGLSGSATFTANQSGNSNFTVSIDSGYTLPTDAQVSNWNTAYGWGDHTGLYASINRIFSAGNGLTGGGNFGADRSFALGTPSSITLSSTNSVTSNSHTHAFSPGGTTNQYIRGDGSLSNFPTIPTALTVTDNDQILVSNVNTINFVGTTVTDNTDGSVDVKILETIRAWISPYDEDLEVAQYPGFVVTPAMTMVRAWVVCTEAPTGDDIEIDMINRTDGNATITSFTISANTNKSNVVTTFLDTVSEGDVIIFDCTQVGSSNPGVGLQLYLEIIQS